MFEELEAVELTRDLPESGLVAGARGAVVAVCGTGENYEVEFVDDDGTTIAVEAVSAAVLRPRLPCTARDLILALQALPPETLVLVQGYEGGFSPIASISDAGPVQELDRPWCYGRFAHPDEAARLAEMRHRSWISMEGGPPTLVGDSVQAVVLGREEKRDE